MKKDPIVIAMCSDDRGADFMQVAIKSIFINNKDEDIELHLITDGFSNKTMAGLSRIEKHFNNKIEVHTIDAEVFETVPGAGDGCSVPKGALFRFLVPSILNSSQKIIYLDTDVIVETSLRELWNIELNGYAMGGVSDPGDKAYMGWHITGELGFRVDEYINSGVLLMDLDFFRTNRISEKCLGWLKDNPEKALCADQTALNVILRGKIKYLSPKYNLQHFHFAAPDGTNSLIHSPELDEARNNPMIIHFTIFKPWSKIGLPRLPFNKQRFEYYRDLPPKINVKQRLHEGKILRRKIFYYLYNLHLTTRKPSLIRGLIGFDRDVKN